MIYPTITLPTREEFAPDVPEGEALTDERDKAYNAHCTALVEAFAREHGVIRTHYPFDAPDGSTDDTVALDANGAIFVLDAGVA